MKKLNQKGLIGPVEIFALVLLVGVIGFTVWRVVTIRSEVDQSLSNTNDSSQSGQLNPIKVNEQEADEQKEVTVPKEEVPKETVAVAEEEKPKTTQQEDKKKEITYIKFTSRSAEQSGGTIQATGVLASAQSGTCHFKFKKEGQEKVYKTAALSSSKTCSKSIPVSNFPVSGEWQYYVWFTSSDNKTQAYSEALGLEVTL